MTDLYYPPLPSTSVKVKSRTDGDAEVPAHDVAQLPSPFTTDTTAIKTAVQALAALISGGRFAVELSTTVVTYIQTLAGAVTSARMAVNVDSTTTGKLDSIIAGQGVPAGGPKFGYKGGIGSSGNETFASKALARGCVVVNLDATNNLLISVGTPGATDVDTHVVLPRTASGFIACSNANAFNMRSSTGTIAATYAGA